MLGMQCELMAVITLWLRIPVTYCVFASLGVFTQYDANFRLFKVL